MAEAAAVIADAKAIAEQLGPRPRPLGGPKPPGPPAPPKARAEQAPRTAEGRAALAAGNVAGQELTGGAGAIDDLEQAFARHMMDAINPRTNARYKDATRDQYVL